MFYGKLTAVPWNIVKYNVFPDSQRGPELYGSEPVHFYLYNLLLNFNVLVPFALFALPALAVTYRVDSKRLGERYQWAGKSSPYTLLAIRLAPFYLWLAIMTLHNTFPILSRTSLRRDYLCHLWKLLRIQTAVECYVRDNSERSSSSCFRLEMHSL